MSGNRNYIHTHADPCELVVYLYVCVHTCAHCIMIHYLPSLLKVLFCRNFDPPIWYDTTIKLFQVHKTESEATS